MAELQRGTVKWFNDAKGFGFIEHESGKDIFIHYSVIESDGYKTLKDGEEVEYELADGDKGLHAAKVFRVNVKQEKKADDESVVAPNLEAGIVASVSKPLVDSLEIENCQSANENNADDLASASDETHIGKA
ncbi:MAG: cold shock domain-containing protein [Deltaproteobacteria bacterium]|nr:cold shock domain-containing protein [Deltaproteobacteria bacterium]